MASSTAFRWYYLPNQRIMAKFDVAAGLTYVVNFILTDQNEYDCFTYPSISSQNNAIKMDSIQKMDQRSMQEKVYTTLMKVLREFTDKYKPEVLVFTTQFQNQLSKISSSTIPGYSMEYSSGGQIKLKKS